MTYVYIPQNNSVLMCISWFETSFVYIEHANAVLKGPACFSCYACIVRLLELLITAGISLFKLFWICIHLNTIILSNTDGLNRQYWASLIIVLQKQYSPVLSHF